MCSVVMKQGYGDGKITLSHTHTHSLSWVLLLPPDGEQEIMAPLGWNSYWRSSFFSRLDFIWHVQL